MQNQYKVKLRSQVTNIVVAFDVVPDVSEQRSVEYKGFNPIHSPGTIYSYSHTPSRIFSINNARLISRTPEEAARNLARLNILRSWTLPYFGQASNEQIGLPPDVLSFYAFSRGPSEYRANNVKQAGEQDNTIAENFRRNNRPTHLQNVPVIINNLQITYPSDVDYVPTAELEFLDSDGQTVTSIQANEPMPTVMAIDIQMFETQSPSQLNRFSLRDYRAGTLENF